MYHNVIINLSTEPLHLHIFLFFFYCNVDMGIQKKATVAIPWLSLTNPFFVPPEQFTFDTLKMFDITTDDIIEYSTYCA